MLNKWETFSLAGFEQNIQMNRYRFIGLGDILYIIIYALIILIQIAETGKLLSLLIFKETMAHCLLDGLI